MDKKIEIVAEIAQGYEGQPKLAELLVKGALVAGADAVKIQLVYADELCVGTYPYFDLFKSLEMPDDVWKNLVAMVRKEGKKIYFDVYGERSLQLASRLEVDGVKISTTDFYNVNLIKKAFDVAQRVFVSTGGVPIEDVDALVNAYGKTGKLTLMHGFQAEPTAVEDNNLARISTLRDRYASVKVGFMDHALGCDDEAFYLPLMAIAQGVSVVEKHITLDYSLKIEDYVSALSVDRFGKFVEIVRKMEPALGNSALSLTAKEVEYKKRAGKVAVAARALPAGHRLAEADLVLKRVSTTPSDLYFPQLNAVLGKTLRSGVTFDQAVEKGNLS